MTYSDDDDNFVDNGYADDGYADENYASDEPDAYAVEYADVYGDDSYPDDRVTRASRPSFAQLALDWGISGSILAILVLTGIYAFSPADAVPDLVPVAGQVNDLAAVLAGGGTLGFLVALRFILRTRIGHWGWPPAIMLSAVAAFAVFYALAQIFDALIA